jgi:NAD(P)-dependent dehydrogenase (short-subunit alcohol dehydrogenase family)
MTNITSNNKRVLITGATSGIGQATALELAKMGWMVDFTSRDKAKGEKVATEIREQTGNQNVQSWVCDLASFKQVNDFCVHFISKINHLDVLINNAGVWDTKLNITEDGIENTFQVNHLSMMLMTLKLLDLLKKSAPSRIVNVSSLLHKNGEINWDDLENPEIYNKIATPNKQYAPTKLMNAMFTIKLARMLEGTGVVANCLHPGVIKTNLISQFSPIIKGGFGLMSKGVDEGCKTSVYLATSEEGGRVSGQYFDNSKIALMSQKAKDEAKIEELWNRSMKYIQGWV